jgi:hypothetical protein
MKIYTYSTDKYALKINGEMQGVFNEACIEDCGNAFLEALPVSGGEPVRFLCNYTLKSRKNAVVHTLPDGMFIRFIFPSAEPAPFCTTFQKRFGATLVTVYTDGATRIVCENAYSAEVVEVPRGFCNFSAECFGCYVLVKSYGAPCFATVFDVNGKISVRFANVVDNVETSPAFRTKTRLFNLEHTTVECIWKLSDGAVQLEKITHARPYAQGFGEVALRRAFLERVLYGLNTEELLCDKLKPNAHLLKEYLGGFLEILPDFTSKKGACLSYEGIDRRTVKIFDIETTNGLISNVIEV